MKKYFILFLFFATGLLSISSLADPLKYEDGAWSGDLVISVKTSVERLKDKLDSLSRTFGKFPAPPEGHEASYPGAYDVLKAKRDEETRQMATDIQRAAELEDSILGLARNMWLLSGDKVGVVEANTILTYDEVQDIKFAKQYEGDETYLSVLQYIQLTMQENGASLFGAHEILASHPPLHHFSALGGLTIEGFFPPQDATFPSDFYEIAPSGSRTYTHIHSDLGVANAYLEDDGELGLEMAQVSMRLNSLRLQARDKYGSSIQEREATYNRLHQDIYDAIHGMRKATADFLTEVATAKLKESGITFYPWGGGDAAGWEVTPSRNSEIGDGELSDGNLGDGELSEGEREHDS